MKAYKIWADGINLVSVCYAETPGKAKCAALYSYPYPFEDYSYTELHATRLPVMDDLYNGKPHADWGDPVIRKRLYEECGFRCSEIVSELCEHCCMNADCEDYQDWKEWNAD